MGWASQEVERTVRQQSSSLRHVSSAGVLSLLAASALVPVVNAVLNGAGALAALAGVAGNVGDGYLTGVVERTAARLRGRSSLPASDAVRDTVREILDTRKPTDDTRAELVGLLHAVGGFDAALRVSQADVREHLTVCFGELGNALHEVVVEQARQGRVQDEHTAMLREAIDQVRWLTPAAADHSRRPDTGPPTAPINNSNSVVVNYPYPLPPRPPPPRRSGKRRWWLSTIAAVVVIATISAIIPNDDDDPGGPDSAPNEGVRAAIDGTQRVQDPPAQKPDDAQSEKPADEPSATEFREPEVHQGAGDDVVSTDWPAQLGIVTFECPACSGYTAVETDGAESLLVTEIGPYTGTQWINQGGGHTTQFVVTATGAWTLTVSDLDAVRHISGEPATGDGDDVVFLDEESTQAAIANQGGNFFSVEVLSSDAGWDLPVIETGSYQGTVPLRGPALVQLTSTGHWSLDPS